MREKNLSDIFILMIRNMSFRFEKMQFHVTSHLIFHLYFLY